MQRNNSQDKNISEIERKRRERKTFDQTLELLTQHLNSLETQLSELEEHIAASRIVIADNQTDIDFIRSLDTDNLYGADGRLNDDVRQLLKKHGYDNLDDKSQDDICHILTSIEVRAIEQNDHERDKIRQWTDRHTALRQEAIDAGKGVTSETHNTWANDLSNLDPEQLARKALNDYSTNDVDKGNDAETVITEAKATVETTGFTL